jgi:hypothetical protein
LGEVVPITTIGTAIDNAGDEEISVLHRTTLKLAETIRGVKPSLKMMRNCQISGGKLVSWW